MNPKNFDVSSIWWRPPARRGFLGRRKTLGGGKISEFPKFPWKNVNEEHSDLNLPSNVVYLLRAPGQSFLTTIWAPELPKLESL